MKVFSFPKFQRILKRRHFYIVSKYGVKVSGEVISLSLLENTRKKSQKLGITVSRKYGKANKRNYFKRIVREAFRLNKSRLPLAQLVVYPLEKAKHKKLKLQSLAEELVLLSSLALKKEKKSNTSLPKS